MRTACFMIASLSAMIQYFDDTAAGTYHDMNDIKYDGVEICWKNGTNVNSYSASRDS